MFVRRVLVLHAFRSKFVLLSVWVKRRLAKWQLREFWGRI